MRDYAVEVTLDNLAAGLSRWNDLASAGNWPRNLHADLYARLSALASGGLTPAWWEQVVDELWAWRAIRPLRKSDIRESGLPILIPLSEAHLDLSARNLTLETAGWKDIEPLFSLASSIKPTRSGSPVFASKLCHFILPALFVVIDREAVGLACPYEVYWEACAAGWRNRTAPLSDLTAMLARQVGDEAFGLLPVPTKTTELCVIGSRNADAPSLRSRRAD